MKVQNSCRIDHFIQIFINSHTNSQGDKTVKISTGHTLSVTMVGMALLVLSQAVFSANPSSSASSSPSSVIPVPLTVSASPTQQNQVSNHTQSDIQVLGAQISQLRGVLDTLLQQETQQQNELSLLQQRVLQLEAQNELARSKLHQDPSLPPSDASASQAMQTTQSSQAQNSSAVSANTIPVVADSPENSALYATAYGFINQGEYKKAESALKAYLLAEPKGINAPDAHYWLGEINMVNAQSDVAAKEFRMVIAEFPNSQKAPSAMRELGEIFLANGDSQHAKQTLQMVVKKYPDTAAAVLAQKTLETM
jgi:tol-pal system protein YbgF